MASTSFNKQNPFNRPSPFKSSLNQPAYKNLSHSPSYTSSAQSYTNINIIQSQVKPITTSGGVLGGAYGGYAGTYGGASGRPSLYGGYDGYKDRGDVGGYGGGIVPDTSLGGVRSDDKIIGRNSISDNPLTKQNPFMRANLLGRRSDAHSNSYQSQQLYQVPGSLTTNTKNYKMEMTDNIIGTSTTNIASYEHLRYNPGVSTRTQGILPTPDTSPVRSYSPTKPLTQDYLNKYSRSPKNANLNLNLNLNYNNVGDDRSDTGSVRTYINKISDIDDEFVGGGVAGNPFNRRSLLNGNGNVSGRGVGVDGRDDGVKRVGVQHLQYRPGSNNSNIPVSGTGMDKYKFQYEQQKKSGIPQKYTEYTQNNNNKNDEFDTNYKNIHKTNSYTKNNSKGKYEELQYKPTNIDYEYGNGNRNGNGDGNGNRKYEEQYSLSNRHQNTNTNTNTNTNKYESNTQDHYDKYGKTDKYEDKYDKYDIDYDKRTNALSDIQANRLMFKKLGLENQEEFVTVPDKFNKAKQWENDENKNGFSEKYIGRDQYNQNNNKLINEMKSNSLQKQRNRNMYEKNYEFEDYNEEEPQPEPIKTHYNQNRTHNYQPALNQEYNSPQFGSLRPTNNTGLPAKQANNVVLFDSDDSYTEKERNRYHVEVENRDERSGGQVPVQQSRFGTGAGRRQGAHPNLIVFKGVQFCKVDLR